MAGAYPDVPGRRIEYDRDGSGVIWWDGSTITDLAGSMARQLNDEGESGQGTATFPAGRFVGITFPVLHDITGWFTVCGWQMQVETSPDTTTGVDGTWTVRQAQYTTPGGVGASYRTNILTPAGGVVAGVKGVRFKVMNGNSGSTVTGCHIYGHRSGSTGNWLTFWHPTLDQPLHTTPAYTDIGDKGRGFGQVSINVRVRNQSPTRTANGVTVIREALTDGTPTMVSLTDMSYNGSAYATTATIGDLGPATTSLLLTVRPNISATAPVGTWAPRVIANAASWS